MKRILCILLMCALLPACTYFKKTSSGSEASASDVYLDEFADIPIPSIMKVDRKTSMVSVTSEGAKTGLVTVTGSVDKISLSSAMIQNMSQQGWTLRGMVRGERIIELFEKENRFAVLSFYDRSIGIAMELWVGQRLASGAAPIQEVISGTLRPSDPGYGTSSTTGTGN